jgi:hypothetical protein
MYLIFLPFWFFIAPYLSFITKKGSSRELYIINQPGIFIIFIKYLSYAYKAQRCGLDIQEMTKLLNDSGYNNHLHPNVKISPLLTDLFF